MTLAPSITAVVVNQPMPTNYTGGTIASGTYYETQKQIYQGSSDNGGSDESTLIVDATALTAIVAKPGNYVNATYVASGTMLTLNAVCGTDSDGGIQYAPDGGSQLSAVHYTATSTMLTIFDTSKYYVVTFVKQ